ncbi:MAG: alpha-L-rhamnosidase N-terminal domain-containing protein, partial [Lentisphaeria bacterium]|nr:alpha-L-rhamnosidase N-terminal domain-containing protein [Lentisphaeria bacterium]
MAEPVFDNAVKWIWDAGKCGRKDSYKAFRKTFDLEEVPGVAAIQISADSTFALYVNGKRVPGNQFSDYPMERSYSTFDVADLLQKGENVIAVSVHYIGEKFHVYMPGIASLRLVLFSGREIICASDNSWKCADEPGFVSGSGRKMTGQAGFIFEYDARLELPWKNTGFDDTEWKNAGVYDDDAAPVCLSRRPVPQLQELQEPSSSLALSGWLIRREDSGKMPGEMCFEDFIRPGLAPEVMDLQELMKDPLLSRKAVEFKNGSGNFIKLVPMPEDGSNGVILQFDLQQEECGYLHLCVKSTAGTVIDIAHGEHLLRGRVLSHCGTYNFADRYICKEGVNDFIYLHRRIGCRYLELHITGITGEFSVKSISLIPLRLPLPREAGFVCEDGELLRLNEISRHTMKLCMHEHYEDCPWREQALWNFDARIQMLLGYYVWGNYDFAAASLELMRKSCKNGFLALTERGDAALRTIPMFSFAYIAALHDRLLFGDFWDGLKIHLPTVDEIIDNALQYKKDNLYYLPADPRLWHFYEWAGEISHMGEFPQSLWNIYLFEALKSAAYLHDAMGNGERAKELAGIAGSLASAVEERFREPELYGVLEPGRNKFSYALTQCLMICHGLVPEDRLPRLWNSLNSGKLIGVTPQNQLFEMEAMMNC